jgi:endonuclease/exonuclease/phosphatase family metal-dependent hydrolase
VIAAGDLNEGPAGSAWRMIEDGLSTAHESAPTFPASLPARRIDGIFVSPDITIEKYEVVDDERTLSASDHLPVLADLVLPAA